MTTQRHVELSGRRFTYTDTILRLPRAQCDEMIQLLQKWQTIFPRERTYTNRMYGIPSLMARFDCTLRPDGSVGFYEIQEGCGWVGYAGIANPAFGAVRDELYAKEWPQFKLLAKPDHNHDDLLWLEPHGLEEVLRNDYPIMMRYSLQLMQHDDIPPLIARTVRPVAHHGDKQYGVEFGWWRRVSWGNTDRGASLPWDKAFVLKPDKSWDSIDIMIWKPGTREGATRAQMLKTLEKRSEMLLQQFIEPMPLSIAAKPYRAIFRPFFGYVPRTREWIPMHGVWTARPTSELRIHGAADAISGPLIIDD